MPKADTGVVDIRGKQYQTVALRVQLFREKHPDHSLTTAIVCRDDDCVVMQATIGDPAGRVIATGHSEEYRKSSQINRTSALENAETSAIGRALAAFGMGGTEFASANEVVNAIHQQGNEAAARGQSKESAVSPTAAPLSDADWVKLTQLVQVTNSNVPMLLKAIGSSATSFDDGLSRAHYDKAIAALETKLAKMAKAETDAKAEKADA